MNQWYLWQFGLIIKAQALMQAYMLTNQQSQQFTHNDSLYTDKRATWD